MTTTTPVCESAPMLYMMGDTAIMAYCHDEDQAFAWARQVRELSLNWVIDVVQAYMSVAVYLDRDRVDLVEARSFLETLLEQGMSNDLSAARLILIPCCYELGLDLDSVASHSGLTRDQVIACHSETIYTVYAIGFCPGFPYMGYLAPALAGVPRLPSPRLRVDPGSVGLTGRQTGIYTEPRPGGWNLIGRTPLELVNVADGYFPLRTGDIVKFEPIDRVMYEALRGQRLAELVDG